MKHNHSERSPLRWIISTCGPAKFYVVLCSLLQTLLGFSSVADAMLLRNMIDRAVEGNRSGFITGAVIFAVLVMTQLLARGAASYLEDLARSTAENRIKARLFRALLTRDYASVTLHHTGDWMNRLTSDSNVIGESATQLLPGLAGLVSKLVGAISAISYLEPLFLLILIPGGLVMCLSAYVVRKKLKKMHKRIQEANGRLRVFLMERLSSLMIVRSFAKEKQSIEQADVLMENHRQERLRRCRFSILCSTVLGAGMYAVYLFGAIFCGFGILNGTMTYGDLTAILRLVSQIQNPFAGLSGYLPRYYAMIASAERLMDVERYPSEHADPISDAHRDDFYRNHFRSIRLRKLDFSYRKPDAPDEVRPVLHGFDMELKKGEIVAFTGPSGCGKSTVLKLLLAFYHPDSGSATLLTDRGEEPLNASWRSLFAYVPQENQLLSGTIRQAVAFGDETIMQDETRIWEALRVACAEDFVRKLELGLDTALGERGSGLSEGQMQRIAIARAICSERPILLLDEATSALDEATADHLLESIRSHTSKTVILVTHRSENLRHCDRQIFFSTSEHCKVTSEAKK